MIFRLQMAQCPRESKRPMEVLLLTDIAGIGKKNDLIVVKSGFALNHLLPNRKALVVTPNVRKRYAEQIKQRALERDQEKQLQTSLQTALGGKIVRISASVSPTGKLYAAVSDDAICDAIKKQYSTDVSPRFVSIPSPIKTVGNHMIRLTIGAQSVELTVEVTNEKAAAKKKEAKA